MYEVFFGHGIKKQYEDLHLAMRDMENMLDDGEEVVIIRTDNEPSLDMYIAVKTQLPKQYARYSQTRIACQRIINN